MNLHPAAWKYSSLLLIPLWVWGAADLTPEVHARSMAFDRTVSGDNTSEIARRTDCQPGVEPVASQEWREAIDCTLREIERLTQVGNLDRASRLLHEVEAIAKDISYTAGLSRAVAFTGDLLILQGRYSQAINLLQKAWNQYKETENGLMIGNLLAGAYRMRGDYTDAFHLYTELIEDAENRDDAVLEAGLKQNLAVVYEQLGAVTQALEYYTGSLELAESEQDTLLQVVILNNIGELYNKEQDLERAYGFVLESYELSRQVQSKDDLSRAALNLGNISREMGRYDEAVSWYQQSLQLAEEMGNIVRPVQILFNMGNIAMDQGNYEEAKESFRQSLALSEQYQIRQGFYYNNLGLGDYYRIRSSPEEAAAHFERALEVAKVLRSLEWEYTSLDRLQQIMEEAGDTTGAFVWLKQRQAVSDSLQVLNQEAALARYQIMFDLRSERLQNDLLAARLQGKNQTIVMAMVLLVIIAFGLFGLFYLYRKQRSISIRYEKQNRELSVLYDQVNRQKRELMTLNETKDKLFSILAHDLRSPITQLQSLVFLIHEEVLDQVNPEEVLDQIDSQLSNSIRTLENYLNWAQAQLDGLEPQMEPVPLYEKVEEVTQQMEREAQEKQITIHNDVDPDAVVMADANMLRIIIQNLISNAIKFSYDGGVISMDSQRVGSRRVFMIRDRGIGISPKRQEVLFKAFHRSEKGTHDEKGTGLGLSICREFVDKQGGEIRFESQPGQGTAFYIELKDVSPSAVQVKE